MVYAVMATANDTSSSGLDGCHLQNIHKYKRRSHGLTGSENSQVWGLEHTHAWRCAEARGTASLVLRRLIFAMAPQAGARLFHISELGGGDFGVEEIHHFRQEVSTVLLSPRLR